MELARRKQEEASQALIEASTTPKHHHLQVKIRQYSLLVAFTEFTSHILKYTFQFIFVSISYICFCIIVEFKAILFFSLANRIHISKIQRYPRLFSFFFLLWCLNDFYWSNFRLVALLTLFIYILQNLYFIVLRFHISIYPRQRVYVIFLTSRT